jgi:phage/plasmid-like protein (TIGR03299 family)
MAHEVETMMYVGETPWHGLGTKLDAPPSIAEALKLSGLDWGVSLVQLQMPDGRKVDRFATVRSTDQRVLGTVGPGYRPVQNADGLSFFEPFVATGAAKIEAAGSLREGSKVWMLAKIDRPDSVIVPQADDRVSKYLLLANGHDGSLAVNVALTPIRVVCQNTLNAAFGDSRTANMKIRHTSGAGDALKEVQKTIQKVDHDFEKAADIFRGLAGVKIRSAAQLREYVDRVFSPNKKIIDVTEVPEVTTGASDLAALLSRPARISDTATLSAESGNMTKETKSRVFEEVAVMFEKGRGNDLPGVRGTAWAAYNAVTEYMTWERGSSADNRMDALWMKGAGVAQRAASAAKEMFLDA